MQDARFKMPSTGPETISVSEVEATSGRRLRIAIINPKFDPTLWSADYSLEIYGGDVKCYMMTGAMAALAGLIDRRHHIEIIDENIEEIDYDHLRDFDIVGVTGLIVQRAHMYRILKALKGLGPKIAVGGALITCDEKAFEDRCDVSFIGEAETTWPAFIEDVAAGRPVQTRYQQADRTDMSKVPTPRMDLMKADRYRIATLQFSRGCPFECEFCDIIVMFGRLPRVKSTEQMIAELNSVVEAGFNNCFIVDDNFIGNKREAKRLLRAIIEWQKTLEHPINFATEVSVNLADNAELLQLMVEANFSQILIGIESPNPESLKEVRKTQNVRGDSLADKLKRIRDSGLIIMGSFIVGFDEDTKDIFEAQYQFIQDCGLGVNSLNILAPIPTTPLYDRLEKEGRLYPSDSQVAFIPKQMTRDELRDGYSTLVRRVNEPDAFFERVFRNFRDSPGYAGVRVKAFGQRRRDPTRGMKDMPWPMVARLMRAIARRGYWSLIPAYMRAWRWNRALGEATMPAPEFFALCLRHWHLYCTAQGTLDSLYLGRHGFDESLPGAKSEDMTAAA